MIAIYALFNVNNFKHDFFVGLLEFNANMFMENIIMEFNCTDLPISKTSSSHLLRLPVTMCTVDGSFSVSSFMLKMFLIGCNYWTLISIFLVSSMHFSLERKYSMK